MTVTLVVSNSTDTVETDIERYAKLTPVSNQSLSLQIYWKWLFFLEIVARADRRVWIPIGKT